MGNRRFAQVATSDDEDEAPPPTRRRLIRKQDEEEDDQRRKQNNRKKTKTLPAGGGDEEEEEEEERGRKRRRGEKNKNEEVQSEEDSKEDESQEDAKPIGELVRVSGKGRGRRTHYEAFDLDGTQYDLEDPVLLVPEDRKQKPYVAIIKDISQNKDGGLMVTGQWFYRPEEAEKRGGGSWQSRDIRELFYSFHRDEVPAESVMHKCVVHFVPLNKQIPNRKEHPGFIVQRVYDTVEQKLWKLTDKDYEDKLQHEINLLVEKTRARLGELPDIETEETAADLEDPLKSKRTLRKKNMSPLDVSKQDDLHLKSETPASCTSTANASEYYTILQNFNALTGDTHRDKWLEKLLRGIQFVFNCKDNGLKDNKEKGGSDRVNSTSESKCSEITMGSQDNILKGSGSLLWPDDAVPAVSALEKASHDALSSEYSKYNQKMRQLVFNLGNNAALTRRLLNGELEPSKILNMSPTELKEGLTAEELAVNEPEESARMQMTDARCRRCQEKQVGLLDIIQAGHGARYQLECIACGNNWYASRDEASTLTIDGPSSARSVGTAPWATSKFEDVEKALVSPRESEKPVVDVFKKTTQAYMPVLESQKSFGKSKTDDNPAASTKNAE